MVETQGIGKYSSQFCTLLHCENIQGIQLSSSALATALAVRSIVALSLGMRLVRTHCSYSIEKLKERDSKRVGDALLGVFGNCRRRTYTVWG